MIPPADSSRIARRAIAQVASLDPCSIWWIIFIILLAGLLGGCVNFFFSYTPNSTDESQIKRATNEPVGYFWNCLIVGVGAAFLVPLLLYLLRSDLLRNLFNDNNCSIEERFVLFSFCLIASISAFRFIPALSDKLFDLIKQVNKLEQKTDQTAAKAQKADQKGDEAKAQAEKATKEIGQVQAATAEVAATVEQREEVIQSIKDNFKAQFPLASQRKSTLVTASVRVDPPNLQAPIMDPTDPQKGRWGGQSTSQGRQLWADVRPLDKQGDWCEVTFTVSATSPSTTLITGEVEFYLHTTFIPAVRTVTAEDGKASLTLKAWGAFTVGAWIANEQLALELDLTSDEVDAPLAFKKR